MFDQNSDLMIERFEKVVQQLEVLHKIQASEETRVSYSVKEIAGLTGRAEFTVREWCRNQRINAVRRECGRGKHGEWSISHDELTRYRNHGLLPSVRTKSKLGG